MLETKVKRYQYGNPFQTDAVVIKLPIYHEPLQKLSHENGNFIYKLEKGAAVYGLGESVRGINKRGWFYTSFCTDDDMHTENKHALYGSHNFLICNDHNHSEFLSIILEKFILISDIRIWIP